MGCVVSAWYLAPCEVTFDLGTYVVRELIRESHAGTTEPSRKPQKRKRPPEIRGPFLVGDTGFEPVTSSV